MSETQVLLSKITALRQRLEQARGLAREVGAATGLDGDGPPAGLARLWALEQQAEAGTEHAILIDAAARPATPADREGAAPLPARLTARARRVLERGRELLRGLRALSEDPSVREAGSPLARLYRGATAMTEAALRLVQALPDSPGGQLALCEGIEATLGDAARRLDRLNDIARKRREEEARIALLADLLTRLAAGNSPGGKPFAEMAEALVAEAAAGAPLRFLHPPATKSPDADWVARFVACHSLTVAQVVARVVRHEPELRGRAVEAVLAALLHDAGMLGVAPAILAKNGPLTGDEKRAVEAHCHDGAELVSQLLPNSGWLAETAAGHHERLDGTGYPGGLREFQVSPLTRLLAVCDVYAARCLARPHRPPRDPRTALTDTLLLAEQGALDRQQAERLLALTFYPVGSAVELADGSLGVVVATPAGRGDPSTLARPVVALVTDPERRFLPAPWITDLAHSESRGVVRALSSAERREVLGTRYPEWAY